MNLQSTVIIGALVFLLFFATLRAERRLRLVLSLFLPLPGLYLLSRWAAYRGAWLEFGFGIGLALLGLGAWWHLVGRDLPKTDQSIRVWDEDDPF